MSDVVRVPIEAGGPEGTNSAYVLPDRGVVVDPGPPMDDAWRDLVAGIGDAGLAVDDVTDVLVTHWHLDHSGLAPRLAEASGAEVTMHHRDAPVVASYAEARERRLERDGRKLRSWGVPDSVIESVRAADRPSSMPAETEVRRVRDGESVAGLEVVATPGHTAGHVAFRDGHDLLVGDAVLPMYTPNVGGSDVRLTDPLETYLETLDAIEGVDCIGHPGHGTAVVLHDRVGEIRDHHRERTSRVRGVLSRSGPCTPWEVAVDLFGEMSGIHAKMGAGESAAHLTRLLDEGTLRRVADDPMTYELA